MTILGFCRSAFLGLAVFFTLAILPTSVIQAVDNALYLEAPDSLAVAITIDSENLIELYQSLPGLKIIDSRQLEDRNQGYIEASTNLPLSKTNCAALAKMAKSKDQALVFYCNGAPADSSIDAIQIASSCGYKRLFWFRGGFGEWADKDYPYMIE